VEELLTKENQTAKLYVSKRRSVRVEVALPVRFTDLNGQFRHGKTRNISVGGVFISAGNVSMPVGVFTNLCIDLPNDSPILVYGKVVWTNRYGFGIKFVSLDPKDKSRVRTLIRKIAVTP